MLRQCNRWHSIGIAHFSKQFNLLSHRRNGFRSTNLKHPIHDLAKRYRARSDSSNIVDRTGRAGRMGRCFTLHLLPLLDRLFLPLAANRCWILGTRSALFISFNLIPPLHPRGRATPPRDHFPAK